MTCICFFQASYGMRKRLGNFTDFNPYFGTDYGICSIIKPQLAFNDSLDGVPYWHKIFGRHNWAVQKGVEVSGGDLLVTRYSMREPCVLINWAPSQKWRDRD